MRIPFHLASLYNSKQIFMGSDGFPNSVFHFLIGNMVLIRYIEDLISMACIFLSISAVKVHDSQAYKNMEITNECISLILELSKIFLSFQMGASLLIAAAVCAILERTSGFDP